MHLRRKKNRHSERMCGSQKPENLVVDEAIGEKVDAEVLIVVLRFT